MENKVTNLVKQIHEFTQNSRIKFVCFVTGHDQNLLGSISSLLMSEDQKVVLLPDTINIDKSLKMVHEVVFEGVIVQLVVDKWQDNWILGMYTSGSTGNPKLFAFTKEHVEMTLRWYQKIYKPSDKSLIITSMPITYNFPFIAGKLTSEKSNSKFTYLPTNKISFFLQSHLNQFDKIILLANPVVLDDLSLSFNNISLDQRLIIDSGGAPLSKRSIMWFRNRKCELHEGYGLTETCSLTHFDIEISEQSLGTVGKEFQGVKTKIHIIDGKPRIQLTTPNLGVQLNTDLQVKSIDNHVIITGDLGRINGDRLELLGRESDFCINGYWPKDTMEIVAAYEPNKCILVEQSSSTHVSVKFWSKVSTKTQEIIKTNIAKELLINTENIDINDHPGRLTHSMKIQRNKNE